MTEVDPRVATALRTQLDDWRTALQAGAKRVGWKIGLNVPEIQKQLGLTEPVIGHLTTATQVNSGATYEAGDAVALRAELEVAVLLGRDVDAEADEDAARDATAGLAAAIELVDVGRPPDGFEAIVAQNIFHRGFVLGPPRPTLGDGLGEARMHIDGELRDTVRVPDDFADVVLLVARHLAAAGERLQAGDQIIAGALINLPVTPGETVSIQIDRLGELSASTAA